MIGLTDAAFLNLSRISNRICTFIKGNEQGFPETPNVSTAIFIIGSYVMALSRSKPTTV